MGRIRIGVREGGGSSLLIFWIGSTGVGARAEVAVSQFAYRPRLTFFPLGNNSGGGGGGGGVGGLITLKSPLVMQSCARRLKGNFRQRW